MSEPSQSFEEALGAGRVAVARGRWAAGLEALNRALREVPTSVEAYVLRGECHVGCNDLARAQADLERSTSLDPEGWLPHHLRGWLALARGELYEACEAFRQSESLGGDGRVSFALAQALCEVGEELEAADAYGRAFAADFGKTEALQERGRILLAHQYYVAALADFSTCCLLEPTVAQHYVNRGNAFYELGDFERASRDYREALRHDQTLAEVSLNLGCIALDDDDLVHAIQHFNQALTLDPSYVRAYLNRGLAYYHNGNDARAEADLQMAFALDPEDPDSAFGLSRLFARQRRYGPAAEVLVRALVLAPEYVDDVQTDEVFGEVKKLQVVREAVAHALDKLNS